jgi:hypothetical protein
MLDLNMVVTIIDMLMPVQENSFTHLRVLVVLADRKLSKVWRRIHMNLHEFTCIYVNLHEFI